MPEEIAAPVIDAGAAPVTPPSSEPVPVTAPEIQAEPKEPQFTSDQDPRDYLRESLRYKEAQAGKKPEEKPEVKPPVETKPAEEVKAEEKTDAEVTDEKKPDEVKTEEKPADPLDKIGPLPAEKIAEVLKTNPALEQEMEKAGLGKETLIANARLAAETSQYKERFPTLEAADTAKQGAEIFYDLDEKFPAIHDAKSYDDFMINTLVPLALLRDDQGNPIPDPDMPGAYKTDGSVARFIKFSNDVEFGQIEKIAGMIGQREDGKDYSQDLLAAVHFLQEFRNNGYRMPGASAGEKPAIPPEVQAELDRYKARDQEITAREQASAQQQSDAFEDKVVDGVVEQFTPSIKAILDQTSLSNYEKEKIAEDTWKDIADTLSKNREHGRIADQMMSRREFTDAIKQRRVAHNINSMKAIYVGILDKHLARAGATRIAKNADLHKKIDTQLQTAKMEPKTGAIAPTGTPVSLTGEQRWAKATEVARATNNGEDPSNADIVKALLKLQQSA